ncbi:MAG: hypothetical protein U0U46_11520 [Saprospiraceae bacterium]
MTGIGSAGIGNMIAGTLTNTTNAPVTVTFSIPQRPSASVRRPQPPYSSTDAYARSPYRKLRVGQQRRHHLYGRSVTLTASGGTTYLWNTTETTVLSQWRRRPRPTR